MLGWTRGKTKRPPLCDEAFQAPGAPSLREVKRVLRDRASALDARLYGQPGASQQRIINYFMAGQPDFSLSVMTGKGPGYILGRWHHVMYRSESPSPCGIGKGWIVAPEPTASVEERESARTLALVFGAEYASES
jgi:hypothetical protein